MWWTANWGFSNIPNPTENFLAKTCYTEDLQINLLSWEG
jgi:hypothetical protein